MKTITRLFLVGLIALGMTACSNEEEVKLEGQPDATVSIRVVPSSNGPVVRATGDLSGDGILAKGLAAESAIKTLEVFLFDDLQGGKFVGSGSATGENVTEVKGIETTSGPKTIVVVANCSIIGTVANKAELLAKTKDLPVVIANGLPMTGMTAAPVILKPGQNFYGHVLDAASLHNFIAPGAPLKVYRVNARVAIVGATLDLTSANSDHINFFDALTDAQVAMFNVPKTSKLFGEELAMNESFFQGAQWVSTGGTYTVGADEVAFLDETVTFPVAVGAAPYYYVNENSSGTEKEQMMIVLRAKPTKGGNYVEAEGLYTTGGYTYYPVWVNATKNGYTYVGDNTGDSKIRRNTQYNISLTIKGIGNPTIDPPAQSFLDVMVSVEDWKVVDQNVIWGETPTPIP